jgi:hypothetical protein
VLQSVESVSAGHTMPPCAATLEMERVRAVVPLPQESEHGDHPLKPVTVQLLGQAPKLHGAVCVLAPHARPPSELTATTARERERTPAPQL